MRILAFDFDGVLCDSSREVFVVAADTFADLAPGSGLLGVLRPLRDDAVAGGDGFRDHEVSACFFELLPLGNRAEDFGVTLRAIEASVSIANQDDYDSFYKDLPAAWKEQFHNRFYEVRKRLRESDPDRWLALHLPYPDLVRALARHRDDVVPAVATAKDAQSVRLLLAELGLLDLFDPRLILDKETGVEKTVHLGELQRRTGAQFSDITFIDDKLNHLVKVAALGVRCVLAGWGFNTDREHVAASRLGYDVAHLDALDTLFKGA